MTAKFDVTNEVEELEKDLAFLQFIQSDEINNVEQFVLVRYCSSYIRQQFFGLLTWTSVWSGHPFDFH